MVNAPIVHNPPPQWSSMPAETSARTQWRSTLLERAGDDAHDLAADLDQLERMADAAPPARRWFGAFTSSGNTRVRAAGWVARLQAPPASPDALDAALLPPQYGDPLNLVRRAETLADRTIDLVHHYLRHRLDTETVIVERFAAIVTAARGESSVYLEITTTDLAAFDDLVATGLQLASTATLAESA